MNKFFTVVIVILVAALVAHLVHSANHRTKLNEWSSQCNDEGGIVSVTQMSWWGQRYECFIDGKKVVLDGWERYQR